RRRGARRPLGAARERDDAHGDDGEDHADPDPLSDREHDHVAGNYRDVGFLTAGRASSHPHEAGGGCDLSSFSNATGLAVITPSTHQSIRFVQVWRDSPSSLSHVCHAKPWACARATFSGVVTLKTWPLTV